MTNDDKAILRGMARVALGGIALIATVIFGCRAVIAQPEQTSANFVMSGCRDLASLINFSGESKEDRYRIGLCSGIILGLAYAGKSYGICLPAGATSQATVNAVVQYVDARPERANDNFMLLAVEALQAVWPCPK